MHFILDIYYKKCMHIILDIYNKNGMEYTHRYYLQKKSPLSPKYNYLFAVYLIRKKAISVIQEHQAAMPSAA
jgi:hypothetical protein